MGSDTLLWQPTYQTFRGLSIDLVDQYDHIIVYDGDRSPDCLVNLRAGYAADYTAEGLSRLSGIENFSGGVGNHLVFGDDRANVISVGRGANIVDAGGGDDAISGSGDVLGNELFPDYETRLSKSSRGATATTPSPAAQPCTAMTATTCCAPWRSVKPMTGGAGADNFEFTAEYSTDSTHTGTVADASPAGWTTSTASRATASAPVYWSAQFGDVGARSSQATA